MAADGLKQRLVGGAALFVIGVIAWFWLLSADSPVDPVSRASQIPPTPDIKPFTVPQPVAPKDILPMDTAPAPVAQRSDVAVAQPHADTAPKTPTPKAVSAKEPARPVAVAAIKSESKVESKPVGTVHTSSETFELDKQGLPVAWVVQIGLYSSQANADKVKAGLQEKGFKAYTQLVKTAKGDGVKVFVGPKLSRERADAQKKAIDQALKANTMVVRFSPN